MEGDDESEGNDDMLPPWMNERGLSAYASLSPTPRWIKEIVATGGKWDLNSAFGNYDERNSAFGESLKREFDPSRFDKIYGDNSEDKSERCDSEAEDWEKHRAKQQRKQPIQKDSNELSSSENEEEYVLDHSFVSEEEEELTERKVRRRGTRREKERVQKDALIDTDLLLATDTKEDEEEYEYTDGEMKMTTTMPTGQKVAALPRKTLSLPSLVVDDVNVKI